MSRIKTKYREEVLPALMKEFQYANIMAAPRIQKVVINMGMGEAIRNPKAMDSAVDELGAITGQKPVITKAKKPISSFKLRKGMPIGCCVTLRRDRMYEFLDRFMNISLARVRDFKGVNAKCFDGRGNFTMGLKDQLIFPEIDYGKVDKARGMNITIVTSARTDEEGQALLRLLGMPFSRN